MSQKPEPSLREKIAEVVMDMPDYSTGDDQAHALRLADNILSVVMNHLSQESRK